MTDLTETGGQLTNSTTTETPVHEEGTCYFTGHQISEQTTLHPYLIYFICALLTVRLIQILIDFRQLRRYKEETPDTSIQEFFDQKGFNESQKFQHSKQSFKICHKIFDLCFDLAFWLLFVQVWIWDSVNSLMATLALCSESPLVNDITQGYLFAVSMLILNLALNLPFSLYFTFVIEEREDSQVKKTEFFCDQLKILGVQSILVLIFIPVLLWLMTKAESRVILIVTLASAAIALNILVNFLLPKKILPLFFDSEDLEDEELKEMIIKEGEKCGITVRNVRVLLGARRQNYSDCFLSGFCGARDVILMDHLLEIENDEEILAIVCQQMGLVKNCNTLKQVIATSIQLVILFGMLTFCIDNHDILISFGFEYSSNFLYLFLFQNLYIPVQFVTTFVSMALQRSAVLGADRFAASHERSEDMRNALIGIYQREKLPLVADPLYSSLNHTHPTLVERLDNIEKSQKLN